MELIRIAKEHGADIVGFAPASRFDKNDPIFKIFPGTKTVIGLAFRVLRGIYRGIEEGSTYYQYTTMAVENMEETIMPMAQLKVAMYVESQGALALPQRRHQQIMAEGNSTNPEVAYDAICRSRTAEVQMNFLDTAVKCGLGEKGLHETLLTDEFGPMVRYCFILTDIALEPTPVTQPHLCDKCGKCVKACPGKAIAEDGTVDPWQCAVYYNGANGSKNPFMPPDAFSGREDRLDIINGTAQFDSEEAKEILQQIYFYPPAKHSYRTSICGRACDRACYIHLEEKGLLTKKFQRKFREKEDWKLSTKQFETGVREKEWNFGGK